MYARHHVCVRLPHGVVRCRFRIVLTGSDQRDRHREEEPGKQPAWVKLGVGADLPQEKWPRRDDDAQLGGLALDQSPTDAPGVDPATVVRLQIYVERGRAVARVATRRDGEEGTGFLIREK